MNANLSTELAWQIVEERVEYVDRQRVVNERYQSTELKPKPIFDLAYPRKHASGVLHEILAFYLLRNKKVSESDTVDIGNRLGFKFMRLPSGEVYAENRGEIWRVHIDQ